MISFCDRLPRQAIYSGHKPEHEGERVEWPGRKTGQLESMNGGFRADWI